MAYFGSFHHYCIRVPTQGVPDALSLTMPFLWQCMEKRSWSSWTNLSLKSQLPGPLGKMTLISWRSLMSSYRKSKVTADSTGSIKNGLKIRNGFHLYGKNKGQFFNDLTKEQEIFNPRKIRPYSPTTGA
jgi:hypothetical protein